MRFFFENCGSALIKDFIVTYRIKSKTKNLFQPELLHPGFSGLSEFNDENHGDLTKGGKNS